MYSLKMIQEANYKLNDSNPIDGTVGDALGTPPFIRRRNGKLGKGAAEEPKKKTSPIDGAVGDPALVRQRRNVELGLGKIVDEERNKKTRRGKGRGKGRGRGRSKPNNVSAEEPNKKTSQGRSKPNNDPDIDVRAKAKQINDKLVADEFWKKRNAWKADFGSESDVARKSKDELNAAKRKAANEEVEKARKRIKTNRDDARAKHDIDKAEAALATNILVGKIDKKIKDNKERKAAINADAHVAARKKHLENKAKTSKQRKNRGAIAAAGLAATGGLIHQNSDAIKSAYDAI